MPAKKKATRVRHQLTIDLESAGAKQALVAEAHRRGASLSTWARYTLFAAVGLDAGQPSRAEFEALNRRVAELETRMFAVTGSTR
jgi:hypothetical protein